MINKLAASLLLLVSIGANGSGLDYKVRKYIKDNGVNVIPVRIDNINTTLVGTQYSKYNISKTEDDLVRVCFVEVSGYAYCMNPFDFAYIKAR